MLELSAAEKAPVRDHGLNRTRARDGLRRISAKQYTVGEFAGLDAAKVVVEIEESRCGEGGDAEDGGCGDAGLHQQLKFIVEGEAGQAVWAAGIGAGEQRHTGTDTASR